MAFTRLMLLLRIILFLYMGAISKADDYDCATRITSEITTCVSNAYPPGVSLSNVVPIPGGANSALLSALCSNDDMVNCLGTLSTCSSDLGDFLKTTVNPIDYRKALKNLCANASAYRDSIDCYQSQKQGLTACTTALQNDQAAEVINLGYMPSKQQLLQIGCKYVLIGIECQDKIIQPNCGPTAANLVKQFNLDTSTTLCQTNGNGVEILSSTTLYQTNGNGVEILSGSVWLLAALIGQLLLQQL